MAVRRAFNSQDKEKATKLQMDLPNTIKHYHPKYTDGGSATPNTLVKKHEPNY